VSKTFQELIQIRRDKLASLQEHGSAYPNAFKTGHSIGWFIEHFKDLSQDENDHWNELDTKGGSYCLAGRIKLHRVMGKTSFAQIADSTGMVQLYLRRENESGDGGVPADQYNPFKKFDLGDIVGAVGVPYRTNKGELSLRVREVRLLTKSLRPLPDKHAGLADQETCYRQRYLDLMVNPASMQVFLNRSRIVREIRSFMENNEFIEVETPMMHSIPGGANARPFITHHNTLDMQLYLRIAPELYLKRLIVGGMRRVFEINRNFRNEGLSPRHNPEFTMMEFYQSFADYRDLMELTETLLQGLSVAIHGDTSFDYQGQTLSFKAPFQELTMKEAVLKHYDLDLWGVPLSENDLATDEAAAAWWKELLIHGMDQEFENEIQTAGKLVAFLFEECAEDKLIQPTFITEFPIEISPLARRNDDNPEIADRFELFIAGQEIANGFSELNDPDDQADRFRAQVEAKEGGDNEAMHFDADYITALEYGMPPTAGEGIGIDRLAAILLDCSNIRDVILFPQMRPK
jgi:lysyl-tRNA synthetase class 2